LDESASERKKLEKLNVELHNELAKLKVELKLKENSDIAAKKEIADLQNQLIELEVNMNIAKEELVEKLNKEHQAEKEKGELAIRELEIEIAKRSMLLKCFSR
jgi:hypothetical protein